MKILFYQNRIIKKDIISAQVHIIEVLNNILKLGHAIIYADGDYHSFTAPSRNEVVPKESYQKSYWGEIKNFISNLPFKGEALIFFYFLKEIKLFLSAFRTALRSKPDIIYRRHTIFNSEYILSRIFKIPCVREVNGIVVDEYEMAKKGDAFSLWIMNHIEKYNLKKSDKYIVVTPRLKELLFNDYKLPHSKSVIVENGANTDLFVPMDTITSKKELNLDIKYSYLCFVGGLGVNYGVEYIISAMPLILKEFPDTKALIIGEGASKNKFQNLSNQIGVSDKVIFTGAVSYEEVPLYINASEICLVPSTRSKRNLRIGISPLKLCEYLACEKPVIATRMNGLEFIEEYNCGYLINMEYPEELAKAIATLLNDPSSKKSMGENGRKYVLENRSWEIQTKKVAVICENTINEQKKSRK